MSEARIDMVGPADVGLLADLYNQVFSPRQDKEFFDRRFQGRNNVSLMIASVDNHAVGFIVGFELMPLTYFTWLCGVLPDMLRQGIATQQMQAQEAWAKERGYSQLRFECQNQHRPMLHLAITEGYDLVGIRYDTATANNVVIFEKDLR